MSSKNDSELVTSIPSSAKSELSTSQRWTKDAQQIPTRFEYHKTQTIDVSVETLRQNRIISALQPCSFTNAYKIMRNQILHTLRDNNWNTLAITSAGRHEGKTLTAINLAISIAMEVNHTVLLVDANLRNPDVLEFFGLPPSNGLSDCLTVNTPIEDTLVNPSGIDRLVILPGGQPLINASEILSSHMMINFVNDVKNRYKSRIVIFDLPPVLVAGDPLAIAPYIDTTLLVVEAAKTKNDDISRSLELLNTANVIGTVLSKSSECSRHF